VLARASICRDAELGEGDPKGLTEEARTARRAVVTLERVSTQVASPNLEGSHSHANLTQFAE